MSREDIVVVESTGNATTVASVISPHVKRVVMPIPSRREMIAHTKIKTDTIDAGVLAQLHATSFLPEVWIQDEAMQALRWQVTHRNQIVRQCTRLKNIIQSILHAHLIPACPATDLCGSKETAGLSKQDLPEDERLAVERHPREFARLGEDLAIIERNLARSALADENVARLMAIPGVDMIVPEIIGDRAPGVQRDADGGRAGRFGRDFRQARRLLLEHSMFPWNQVAFRDCATAVRPVRRVRPVRPVRSAPSALRHAGNHLPDQQRRSCSGMRMADAQDASDGISARRAPPPS